MTTKRAYYGGGRKPTGTLIRNRHGYSAKFWAPCPDCKGPACLACKGKGRVRVTRDLGTDNKRQAKARLDHLLAQANPAAFDASAPETFAAAAKRIIERQRDEDGVKTWSERLSRVNRYCAAIAERPVTAITEGQLDDVLRDAAAGLSAQSVKHLRNDLRGIFGELWRTRAIAEDPMQRVKLPKRLRVDGRPREHLTDAEFYAFVESAVVPDRLKLMALVMRFVGGMRTSDLHAWDWRHVDVRTFASAKVYRPKTEAKPGEAPVTLAALADLEIPPEVREPLKAWWQSQHRHGEPPTGPVFPVAKGKRAGERQGKRSHVRELRHWLWEAGVKRAATKAECSLQTDTPESRAVDVHSFRRAYATGLAAAGVNAQQAMALTGHKDARTHARYVDLSKAGRTLAAPASALPRRQKSSSRTFASRSSEISGRPQRELNPRYRRERPMS